MGWEGHVARMVNRRSVNRFVAGNAEGKRPLKIPRRGWEDNIKLDLKRVDWTDLARDRDK
jgi:hypothetical protein